MLGTSKKNPVIGPLKLGTAAAYAQQLGDSLDIWTSDEAWNPRFYRKASDKVRLEGWQKQFSAGRAIVKAIEVSALFQSDVGPGAPDCFAYLFNGIPVGVMVTTEVDQAIHINDLVTSPATAEAGSVLIETAVRWSERRGFLGRVSVTAFGDDVGRIYSRYGFETSAASREPTSGKMHLTPLTSPAWERSDEGLTLKAKIGKAYTVSGLGPE